MKNPFALLKKKLVKVEADQNYDLAVHIDNEIAKEVANILEANPDHKFTEAQTEAMKLAQSSAAVHDLGKLFKNLSLSSTKSLGESLAAHLMSQNAGIEVCSEDNRMSLKTGIGPQWVHPDSETDTHYMPDKHQYIVTFTCKWCGNMSRPLPLLAEDIEDTL